MKRWAGVLTALAVACVPSTASAALVYVNPGGGTSVDENSAGVQLTANTGQLIRATITGTDPAPDPLPYGSRPRSVHILLDAGTLTTVPAGDPRIPCEIRSAREAICRYPQGSIGAVTSTLADTNDRLVLSSVGPPPGFFVEARGGNDSITVARNSVGGFRWGSEPRVRGGAGNDQITVGVDASQMVVYGDEGNDRIITANGMTDQVHCGLGNDTWVNDPFDEPIYPSDETGCETAAPTL